MTLTFLGTRGEIAIRSRRHRRHTATLLASRTTRILIDAGLDWRGRVERLRPDALILTHAHPDHAGALKDGSPCPVHATAKTWASIGSWPIHERRVLRPWRRYEIGGITLEPVPVVHSVRAPAVGFRVTSGSATVFYVPDIAALPRAHRALAGVKVYVGDGATISRPILRRRGRTLIGHASIVSQLDWCRDCHVTRAIFTHCGSEIVRADHRRSLARVVALGRARGIDAAIACDGERIDLARLR
jgi:phosphoribosyl 1,2-cyclic phosphodiesterase